jgi:prepilin signal peptidase PulO-like enzyme (type II secretory pathway)
LGIKERLVEGVGVLLLSLLAGWAVNVAADALPDRRAWTAVWRAPLDNLVGSGLGAGRVATVWLVALILGFLAWMQAGWSLEALVLALYAWFFLTVAVIDLEHRRVLNRMLLAALPLAAAVSLLGGHPTPASALAGAALGFGLFLVIALARPGGMGMGDVKLAGVIGLTTGVTGTLVALAVGILAGGVAALVILALARFRRGVSMAYAPYLVLGAWVALYFSPDWVMWAGLR